MQHMPLPVVRLERAALLFSESAIRRRLGGERAGVPQSPCLGRKRLLAVKTASFCCSGHTQGEGIWYRTCIEGRGDRALHATLRSLGRWLWLKRLPCHCYHCSARATKAAAVAVVVQQQTAGNDIAAPPSQSLTDCLCANVSESVGMSFYLHKKRLEGGGGGDTMRFLWARDPWEQLCTAVASRVVSQKWGTNVTLRAVPCVQAVRCACDVTKHLPASRCK